eukprot:gene17599-20047_t
MRSTANNRSKAQSSYSNSHASKVKVKEPTESGGKMTKFRSLDDIPDSFPDSVDFDRSSNYSPPDREEYSTGYDGYKGSSAKQERVEDADLYGVRQAIASMKVAPAANVTGKAPPLPYDHMKSAKDAKYVESKHVNMEHHVPVPPNNKYFDYDNSADNFDDDETTASPQGRGAEFIPPLPCESKSSKTNAGQEDSIYFSKKPRPVNFKPYTLKQYKMTQPKEYVEISNIKPDLNSDELVAKRANLERIKEFSKNLQSFNRQTISQQPKLPPAAEKRDIAISEQKFNSRRQKAIEFAKNVPKPRVPSQPTSQQGRGGKAPNGGDGDYDESDYYTTNNNNAHAGGMDMGAEYAHESRIMELEAQHNNRKIQIEAMKKNLGLK